MSKNALIRRAREAKSWLMDACFPLWAEAGVEDGVFAERLDLQHRPDPSDETRVRVQARQTYVFCQAQRLGWRTERSRKLIDLGVSVLDGASRRPDGLMGRVLDRSTAQLLDPTADLYDTAFALFAFSHAAHRRDGSGRALAAAGRTVKALSAIEDPAGGYAEGIPRPANRLQNPHMHLLEAYLAFQAVAPGEVRRNRVRSLRDLGLQRFFEAAQSDAILEVFDRDWTPIDDTIEPGHQFEWCRLLGMTAEVLSESSSSEIAAVYAAGLRGLDAEGRTLLSINPNGDPRDGGRRTWSQAEALRAHLQVWREGTAAAGERAIASFDILMDEFLTPEGGWIDHFDADGRVLSQHMPASTGYHVVQAFCELIACFDD